jgi:hypothetical protein
MAPRAQTQDTIRYRGKERRESLNKWGFLIPDTPREDKMKLAIAIFLKRLSRSRIILWVSLTNVEDVKIRSAVKNPKKILKKFRHPQNQLK